MKRKITLTAKGTNSTTKVMILVNTSEGYMRDETTSLALDIADEIMAALAKKYRASKIRVS